MAAARLHPKCIVEDYLYADVAVMAAPGGTGKTTLILREYVAIILGLPLYGLRVVSPGPCLLITAEDTREVALGRLREIMTAMNLTEAQKRMVRANLLIWDVSGELQRMIELDARGNIVQTPLAERLCAAFPDGQLAVITIDPAVSFGAGERLVNDNEQALIMAARKIRQGTGACVRYIVHTGQAAAREKLLDQYAARGGSALPDGCRMVAVLLHSVTGEENGKLNPPAGYALAGDQDAGAVLARPKLSYAKPNLPLIWIKRTGYHFESITETRLSKGEQRRAYAEQLLTFLRDQLEQTPPRYHTRNSLEAEKLMPREKLRTALLDLELERLIIETALPDAERHGRRKTYLKPLAKPTSNPPPGPGGLNLNSAPREPQSATETGAAINPPPSREWRNGGLDSAAPPSPWPQSAGEAWRISGGLADWEESPPPVVIRRLRQKRLRRRARSFPPPGTPLLQRQFYRPVLAGSVRPLPAPTAATR